MICKITFRPLAPWFPSTSCKTALPGAPAALVLWEWVQRRTPRRPSKPSIKKIFKAGLSPLTKPGHARNDPPAVTVADEVADIGAVAAVEVVEGATIEVGDNFCFRLPFKRKVRTSVRT